MELIQQASLGHLTPQALGVQWWSHPGMSLQGSLLGPMGTKEGEWESFPPSPLFSLYLSIFTWSFGPSSDTNPGALPRPPVHPQNQQSSPSQHEANLSPPPTLLFFCGSDISPQIQQLRQHKFTSCLSPVLEARSLARGPLG